MAPTRVPRLAQTSTPPRRRLIAALIALLAALVALPFAVASPAAAVGETTFTNPLVEDAADPTIEFYDGNYYLVATTWDNRVVMRKASTLAALKTAKPVTVYSDTNTGRNNNMWAPELQRLNGPNGWRWYLMYTMGATGNFDGQHLQVIESAGDDPMGPYSYKGRPLPIDAWNIDGAYLQLNGELFMMWSQFAPDGLQSNYIARMSNPWTSTGPMNILSRPVESWETIGGAVNEGPIPLQHNGDTYVVYSASGCWTPDYELGTLKYTGGDPVLAASWTKSTGPVFTKANGVFGPGHNDFFTSPDGTQTWNLYHANAREDGGCGRERSARAQQVTWGANGTPDFGIPSAGTAVTVPSGENGPITARVEGANWNLVNRTTGQCAVIDGAASGDGTAVTQGSCGSARANWALDATGDGYLRLINAATGKAAGTVGSAVKQSAWVASATQQWTVAVTTDGWSSITNRATNARLLGSEWSLRPAGTVTVSSVASGKVFDLPNCSTADGAVLQQREWLASPCQTATFTGTSDGRVEIHPSSAAQKCLGVTGGSTADGASVTQQSCGSLASRWAAVVNNDGTVEFRAAASGKALDLSYCAAANGTTIGQWSVLNNDCQRFRIANATPAPTVLALAPTVTARCIAGTAYVTTSVKNTDTAPADVTMTTAYGSKTVADVAAGATVSAAFNTRQSSITAGTASVAGSSADEDGRAFAATPAVPAATC